MHTEPMKDSDGTFDEWKVSDVPHSDECRGEVRYRSWDSSCGGYTDYQFKCMKCGKLWWVDGPDA